MGCFVDLLEETSPQIALQVGHFRPEGEAWARFFVLVLVVHQPSVSA